MASLSINWSIVSFIWLYSSILVLVLYRQFIIICLLDLDDECDYNSCKYSLMLVTIWLLSPSLSHIYVSKMIWHGNFSTMPFFRSFHMRGRWVYLIAVCGKESDSEWAYISGLFIHYCVDSFYRNILLNNPIWSSWLQWDFDNWTPS